jgi:AcrR family transcriptional regulator
MEKEKQKEKKQLSEEIKDEILVAALKLFAEKGYFNTSLTDIKDQIGAKTTSPITRQFKTKQTIASELYHIILDNLNISIDDIRRRNKKVVDQLREIVDLMFTLTVDAPEIMRFLLILNVSEFLPEEKSLYQSKPFRKIQKIFEVGVKSGEIRELDPIMIYCQFFGIIFQVITMILNGVNGKKISAYQSSAWMAAWRSIAKA